jgi:hypothetical protein
MCTYFCPDNRKRNYMGPTESHKHIYFILNERFVYKNRHCFDLLGISNHYSTKFLNDRGISASPAQAWICCFGWILFQYFSTMCAWFAGLSRFHCADSSCSLLRAQIDGNTKGSSLDCREDEGALPSQTLPFSSMSDVQRACAHYHAEEHGVFSLSTCHKVHVMVSGVSAYNKLHWQFPFWVGIQPECTPLHPWKLFP